ncbi:MAG: hypothetical protein ACI9AF_001445 [Granulosicoccus sp.]
MGPFARAGEGVAGREGAIGEGGAAFWPGEAGEFGGGAGEGFAF